MRGLGAGRESNPGLPQIRASALTPGPHHLNPSSSEGGGGDGSISDAIRRDLPKLSQANLFSNYFQKATVDLYRKCVRSVLTV